MWTPGAVDIEKNVSRGIRDRRQEERGNVIGKKRESALRIDSRWMVFRVVPLFCLSCGEIYLTVTIILRSHYTHE